MTIWSASVVMAESFKRSLTARHHHHHHHQQQQQQQQNLPVVFAVADRKNEVKPNHYDGVQLLSAVHEKDPLSSADGQDNKEEKDDIITSRSSLKADLSPSQPVRELKVCYFRYIFLRTSQNFVLFLYPES